jgi:hypothetical protein
LTLLLLDVGPLPGNSDAESDSMDEHNEGKHISFFVSHTFIHFVYSNIISGSPFAFEEDDEESSQGMTFLQYYS